MATARRYDRTPGRQIGSDHTDRWNSGRSRWTTWAVREDDGYRVTATCLSCPGVQSGAVVKFWVAGYWPEARENIMQWLRDVEDGLITIGEQTKE